MADSLYNIFSDHHLRQAVKNVVRQPLSNNENVGKMMTGPVKPNEPMKKGDVKKSFLSNTGMSLQSTPARQVFSPRAVNVGALIYKDPEADAKDYNPEQFEFSKPSYKHDNFHRDIYDYLKLPLLEVADQYSPPNTPLPSGKRFSFEFDNSYQDDFFTDDFSNDCIEDDDLGLPDIY